MATVSKNIFWSLITSLLQLYTGSVVFIVLAKLMSVEDFGILSFGFSLSALAIIVADFGFSLMVIKDYPQHESGHEQYVSNSVLTKIFLAFIAAAIFFIYLIVFYDGEWFNIGALYILFAVLAAFIIYLQAVLKAQNRFHKFTESTMVYAITATISILIYWQYQLTLFDLVLCLVGSKLAQMIWTLILCKKLFNGFAYDSKLIKKLLKNSWSFGMHTILGIFYFMIDTQIISLYLGAKEVAIYQSVFRIILILMVLSDIVSNVLLPYLSFKYFKNEDLTELVSKIFLYLLLIACSVFLLFTTFKREVLLLLYTPEYLEASILVLPLSMVVVLRTVSSLLGNILTVSNKQIYRVITVATSLALSLILNLVFIPRHGILSAAWISVVVHLVLFTMYFIYSRLEVPTLKLNTKYNLLLMGVTATLYILIHHFAENNPWFIVACILTWFLTIYGIMIRDRNWGFLNKLLKEKGVG